MNSRLSMVCLSPYSSIADYEIMFGKILSSVWQVGDCSLVPYTSQTACGKDRYLDLIDSSLHDSLYICDMSKFNKVHVQSSSNYHSDLYWGTAILAYHNGFLKPVLVDLSANNLSKCTTNDDRDHDYDDDKNSNNSNNDNHNNRGIYTPSHEDWVLSLRKYYNTHEFCEYLGLVFKRNIPPAHPLYHLYAPFSDHHISGGLLNRGVTGYVFTNFTLDTYNQVIETIYQDFSYDDMMFEKYLREYGFTDDRLEQLPQIHRMLKLWRVASKYVNKYVDTIYGEFDANEDVCIRQWFQELNSGTYKGFDGHLNTVSLSKIKQLFTLHIFQSLVHWSDHNSTHSYLSEPSSSMGYDTSSQGRSTASDKLFNNYILLIANASKLMDDGAGYN